jgi:hypothetical protein
LIARYGYATGTWPERDDAPEITAPHGVLRALMAGMMAGHTLIRVAASAVSESDAIAGYVA